MAFSERFRSNWDLSAARSAAVADYLLNNTNLEDGRVTVTGFADTKPLTSNDTAAGRSKNRRIEVIIDGQYIAFISSPLTGHKSVWHGLPEY